MLEIESKLRTKLNGSDNSGVEFLNELHAQLSPIQVHFSMGLDASRIPVYNGKKGMIKLAVRVWRQPSF